MENTYKITIADGERSVSKTINAVRDYLDVAIDRAFRNKKFREELVKTFLVGFAEITVTDAANIMVAHGKFETNVFSGLSNYTVKIY